MPLLRFIDDVQHLVKIFMISITMRKRNLSHHHRGTTTFIRPPIDKTIIDSSIATCASHSTASHLIVCISFLDDEDEDDNEETTALFSSLISPDHHHHHHQLVFQSRGRFSSLLQLSQNQTSERKERLFSHFSLVLLFFLSLSSLCSLFYSFSSLVLSFSLVFPLSRTVNAFWLLLNRRWTRQQF